MTFGSLFSGIGGIDLGLERAGMECRWQVEIDPYCRAVLAKHWPSVLRFEDVKALSGGELERVDLIAGGFPCQPVARGGRRLVGQDERWLWPEYARLLGILRPRFALMENVPGLLDGGGAGEILAALAEMGYAAEWGVLSACLVGAPHTRERVFVVAYPDDEHGKEGFRVFTEWSKAHEAGYARPHEGHWVESFTGIRGIHHGISRRVERIAALGNAVVPQVAEAVGRMIVAANG